MYKGILGLIIAICLGPVSVNAMAEFAVIAHPATTATISKDDLEKLYLAKTKTLADGSTVVPLNQEDSSAARVAFDSAVVGKSESQMKAYWAKLVFTGKAVPIKQVSDDSEMIKTISSTPGAIGYVDAASVDGSVKVILNF